MATTKPFSKISNNSLSLIKAKPNLPHILNFVNILEGEIDKQKWLLPLNINITVLKSESLSSTTWTDPNLLLCYDISKSILNVVSLPVGMQHDTVWNFWKCWISIQNKNCCSYIYEHELMKMEALSCMIKYLPSFSVNFQVTINASLLLAKCTYPTTIYKIKRFFTSTTVSLLLSRSSS